MLLYNSFLEIYASNFTSSFQGLILTRSALAAEVQHTVANYRCLRDPVKITAYQYLIRYSEYILKSRQEIPMLTLLFEALTAENSPIDPLISCDILTGLFYLHTQNQQDALDLSEIGRVFIDSPIAFAAFIRYLCQRKVKPELILSTHLLHDYLYYYLDTLGSEINPVSQLYQILRTYPETQFLVEKASLVRSEERGFECYKLNGSIEYIEGESIIEKEQPSLYFSANLENLKNLHAIFGSDFLIGALKQWSEQKNNPIWENYIVDVFNRPEVVKLELPIILNKLFELPKLQSILATILNTQTLETLLAQRNGGILCLIPYCPQLANTIHNQDLVLFLNNICQRTTSTLCLISGLLALFNSLKQKQEGSAIIVLDKLIDAILNEPYVLEDGPILKKIRKFSQINVCISQKIATFETHLDEIISAQSEGSLVEMDYITIEDTWRNAITKIQFLQEIAALETKCPTDKYQLYIRIINAFYLKNRMIFDLHTLATALNIAPELREDSITPYERFIIELLAGLDDEAFRTQTIAFLDENIFYRPWRTFIYADQNHYQRTTKTGNLGFIQWLDAEGIAPHTTYDSLAIKAACNKHWPLVLYFQQHHNLKKVTVKILLNFAMEQEVSHVIPLLWPNKKRSPTANQIKDTFLLATDKNDGESIRVIIHAFKAPKDKIMTRAFKLAIEHKHWNAMEAIAEYRKGPCLIAEINKALIEAAKAGQCLLLQLLLPFCELNSIENAFLNAARVKDNIESLKCFISSTLIPRPNTIKRAWNEAKKHKRETIAAYLEPLCAEYNAPITFFTSQLTIASSTQPSPKLLKPQKAVLSRSVSCNAIPQERSLASQAGLFGIRRTPSSPILLRPQEITL